MTDATGIDLHAWFAQWVFKPGHPIIDWSWTYDAAKSAVQLHVRQMQDTSRGTPIYDIPTLADVVTESDVSRAKIHLNAADQTLDIPVKSAPKTVIFDPEHDFVRQIPHEPWTKEDLPYVFLSAVNPIDQEFAMNGLLDGDPSEETLQMVAQKLRKDNGTFPALPDTSKLASLSRPTLRNFWIAELKSPNYSRRANATTGLAVIAHNAEDIDRVRQMQGDDQPYEVVSAALRGLAKIDCTLVGKVAKNFARTSGNQELRRSALDVLIAAKAPGWEDAVFATAAEGNRTYIRAIGVEELAHIPSSDSRLVPAVRSALHAGENPVISAAIQLASNRQLRELIPDLQDLKAHGVEVGQVDQALQHLML
jgi:aminopeptidase N